MLTTIILAGDDVYSYLDTTDADNDCITCTTTDFDEVCSLTTIMDYEEEIRYLEFFLINRIGDLADWRLARKRFNNLIRLKISQFKPKPEIYRRTKISISGWLASKGYKQKRGG